jgi:membrane protein DedA with SNARE-associated domain
MSFFGAALNPANIVGSYVGLGLLLYCTGVGLPIPEEITLVLAGAAVYQGTLELPKMLLVAAVAIIVADIQVYLIGRHFGRPLLEKRFFRFILPPERIAKAQARFAGHSIWAIFTVRFISGLRGPTYFTAGTLRMVFYKFLITDFIAVCLHITAYTTIGYMFSPEVEAIIKFIKRADRWVGVTILLALVLIALYIGYVIGMRRKRK